MASGAAAAQCRHCRGAGAGPVAPQVLLVQSLGFITPTNARRTGLEEAMAFERVHEATYRRFGFEIVPVGEGGTVGERKGGNGGHPLGRLTLFSRIP